MTEHEYNSSECFNRHSKFIFKNGQVEYGVVLPFLKDEPTKYQLVRSSNLREFKQVEKSGDIEQLRRLCVDVDLDDLIAVELLPS